MFQLWFACHFGIRNLVITELATENTEAHWRNIGVRKWQVWVRFLITVSLFSFDQTLHSTKNLQIFICKGLLKNWTKLNQFYIMLAVFSWKCVLYQSTKHGAELKLSRHLPICTILLCLTIFRTSLWHFSLITSAALRVNNKEVALISFPVLSVISVFVLRLKKP